MEEMAVEVFVRRLKRNIERRNQYAWFLGA
jgi:hypothetical protein